MFNVSAGLMVQTIMLMVENQNLSTQTIPLTLPPQNFGGERERCYGDYGCFSIGEPWVTDSRPIGLFPDPPEMISVKYPLITRRNLKFPFILDPTMSDAVISARINPKGPFYIISHGYLEGGDKIWIQKMAEALLMQEGNHAATVMIVDWRGGSQPPYTQAVANIRLVGSITAHVIRDIYEHLKLDNLDNFHFIGHSLGAHCGGYTGAVLQKKFGLTLGRITGMDPAEPHFSKVENIVRLDKTDAKYVDIIHTDATPFISGGLGISESIGHVDFFPNGGSNQPGCNQGMLKYINSADLSIFNGIRKFLSCNHIRSYEFFTESIVPLCPFMSIRCTSYEDFLRGSCFKCGQNNNHCIPFGFHSQRGYKRIMDNGGAAVPMNMYLVTGDKHPFCRIHYRITVTLSASVESSTHGGEVGRLWIVLIYANGTKSEKIPLDDEGGKYHKPGSERTIVVSTRPSGSAPKSVLLEWEYETNLLNPLTWRILSSPRIYVSWVEVDTLEYGTSTRFCSQSDSPVVANLPNHFQPQLCAHG